MFFNDTTGFSIYNISSIENVVFDVKFQFFIVKTVFFTIQTDFRYIILFFSIENLVFNLKFQSLFVKPFNKNSVFHCKNGVFNYTNWFSIHNTIFFYRKPRFRCKISVFHCKNGVFHYTTGFSIHNTIFSIENLVFNVKFQSFIVKTVFSLYKRIFDT